MRSSTVPISPGFHHFPISPPVYLMVVPSPPPPPPYRHLGIGIQVIPISNSSP